MNDSFAVLNSVRADPNNADRSLSLAGWLRDNGRDDESAAVRVYYRAIRDSLNERMTLERAQALVARNAARLARRAREFEEQAVCQHCHY